jgi:hypothetical protein
MPRNEAGFLMSGRGGGQPKNKSFAALKQRQKLPGLKLSFLFYGGIYFDSSCGGVFENS